MSFSKANKQELQQNTMYMMSEAVVETNVQEHKAGTGNLEKQCELNESETVTEKEADTLTTTCRDREGDCRC